MKKLQKKFINFKYIFQVFSQPKRGRFDKKDNCCLNTKECAETDRFFNSQLEISDLNLNIEKAMWQGVFSLQ